MFIPEVLENFKIYQEGQPKLLGTANVKLPEINYMTETVSGSGIRGEYEAPVHGSTSPMEFSMDFRAITQEVIELTNQSASKFECEGKMQVSDTSTYGVVSQSLKVTLRGRNKKAGLGTMQVGKSMESGYAWSCLYIKVEIEGKEVLLIDVLNGVHRVNGVDQ